MDILKDLNDAQRAAVEYCSGSSLIIAGAGSGKTRVLTCKIAYLIDSGLEPWCILALTFTNKAAREMKERIAALIGEDRAKRLWMGTFHSVFSRILRQEAESIGYSRDFTIYEPADSKSLIRGIVKDFNLDKSIYKEDKISKRVSLLKNSIVTSQEYLSENFREERREDATQGFSHFGNIYAEYNRRMRAANAMDFDDLLLNTYLMFRQMDDIRVRYSERFEYILVDEYQDTNRLQAAIVRQLAKKSAPTPVCVVGDDAQSIYAFRGADIGNILSFSDTFGEARLFKLEQNYRSTQTIVEAASSLIRHNRKQIPKTLFSNNNVGELIEVRRFNMDKEEGEGVVARIVRDNMPYNEVAIIYRTNAQSRIFEEILMKNGIKYCVYGGRSFFAHKEIKDVLAYLRFVCNTADEEALKRIINYPTRGIGDTTMAHILEVAHSQSISAWDVMSDASKHLGGKLNEGALKRVAAFVYLMKRFIDCGDNAYELTRNLIAGVGLTLELNKDKTKDGQDRFNNVQELITALHSYCEDFLIDNGREARVADYLAEVSLMTTTDEEDASKKDQPAITLSTVHSVKGLEFENVFIAGMEEGLFPLIASANILEKELEEERRLFYVALTRAKTFCHLSYTDTRFRNGRIAFSQASRFLKEINPKYLRGFVAKRLSKSSLFQNTDAHSHSMPPQTSLQATDIQVGMRVRHSIFGEGVVQEISGRGAEATVITTFDSGQTKKLLLRFAKLQILN